MITFRPLQVSSPNRLLTIFDEAAGFVYVIGHCVEAFPLSAVNIRIFLSFHLLQLKRHLLLILGCSYLFYFYRRIYLLQPKYFMLLFNFFIQSYARVY